MITVPVTTRETVSPEIAVRWLTMNTHNRRFSERSVNAYAADMKADAWCETGSAICFAADGSLLDGQQRLMAIVRSGVTLAMLVTRGLPTAAQEVIDTGRPRSFANILELRGEACAASLASITRRAYAWDRGWRTYRNDGSAGRETITHAQLSGFLNGNPDLRAAVRLAERIRHHEKAIPASVVGVCAWLFARIESEDCEMFFDRYSTGLGLQGEDDPIYRLRVWAREQKDRRSRTVIGAGLQQAHIIKAWNLYRQGRSCRSLRVVIGGAHPEPYPTPE
jgi:hypothetical protein